MNYSEMSDFEISRKVGDIVGVKWVELDHNYHELSAFFVEGLGVFDPCKSWANAGPIIAKEGIAIVPYGDFDWHAFSREEDFLSSGSNPLRQAMIVFLMMQEGK